ncbi:HutD/Ves family protein [Modestobacter excelsi]|uniref:HutD/Ves family protein n=1 Tax=Modestobacter excelsi TaxID=2213161 RepID=UPI001C20F1D9|nr:HutD family protein [Modestobacter excelsi]
MDPRAGSLARYAAAGESPWRNGGGLTRELHAGAGWRLSVATIPAAAEFSVFPGRDRTLVVGRGRLRLAVAGRSLQQLSVGQLAAFPGEAHVTAEPDGGVVQAVNVMVERPGRTASVQVLPVTGPAPAAAALVLLSGGASAGSEELDTFDAVLSAGAGAVRGAGALMVLISIEEGQS